MNTDPNNPPSPIDLNLVNSKPEFLFLFENCMINLPYIANIYFKTKPSIRIIDNDETEKIGQFLKING